MASPQQPNRVASTPNRPMPKGRAIDPIRVLRRHWKGVPIFGIVGGILGVAAFYVFSTVYPLDVSAVPMSVASETPGRTS
ncbi:MAG TPA: hypothetical protein QF528_04210, partial [Phycisphaerales bacterium]|nr:hypothetical protein [Phycisphaerales bacterium]